MIRLSAKLAKSGGQLWHWCPGCQQMHAYTIDGTRGWQWDGDVVSPTVTPSMLCFTTYDEEGEPLPAGARRTLCHYFLTAGKLQFCGDSPHALSGQTVPLPDLPNWV